MSNFLARARAALVAVAFALFVPNLNAQTGRSAGTTADPARPPAGDTDIGMLIIVGAIGFFIIVAWLFSRTGDDGGRGPDSTLL